VHRDWLIGGRPPRGKGGERSTTVHRIILTSQKWKIFGEIEREKAKKVGTEGRGNMKGVSESMNTQCVPSMWGKKGGMSFVQTGPEVVTKKRGTKTNLN